ESGSKDHHLQDEDRACESRECDQTRLQDHQPHLCAERYRVRTRPIVGDGRPGGMRARSLTSFRHEKRHWPATSKQTACHTRCVLHKRGAKKLSHAASSFTISEHP